MRDRAEISVFNAALPAQQGGAVLFPREGIAMTKKQKKALKRILIAAALVFTVRLILTIIKNKKSSEP